MIKRLVLSLALIIFFSPLFSNEEEVAKKEVVAPAAEKLSEEKVFIPSQSNKQTNFSEESRMGVSGVAQVLIFLIVTGAIAYVIVRKTRGNFTPLKNGNGQRIQILDTKSLGGKQFLLVAQYEDTKVLLGVSANGIQALHHFPEKPPKEFTIE